MFMVESLSAGGADGFPEHSDYTCCLRGILIAGSAICIKWSVSSFFGSSDFGGGAKIASAGANGD
jgi:hypothetical protein